MNAVAEALPRLHRSPDTRQMANALRMLAVDAVSQANSGHPGMPMGMAEIAVALWGASSEAQSRRSGLAGSRPLRAVERSWLDAALCALASERL